jgi:succinyl-CoA synthetase beta subunit
LDGRPTLYDLRKELEMKLHEYQAKELLKTFGIPTPEGKVAIYSEEAQAIAEELSRPVVVKAQVHMGGRGKAGGIRLVDTPSQAAEAAKDIIGTRLISAQNPQGMIPDKVLVVEQIAIDKEYYLAITLDRSAQCDTVILSAMGGVDIEEVAHQHPEAIIKLPIDPEWGLWDYQIRAAIDSAHIDPMVKGQLVGIIKNLLKAYQSVDASLIEINPLAQTPEKMLIAADAKVTIDDNALFRQKALAVMQEATADDPIEAEVQRHGIAYVRLTGDIGVIGNGAGLVMSTMDEVSRAGGSAANFLDIGGGASAVKVKQSVEIVLKDPNVKGLFFNIFGGITRGDEVAQGILEAFGELEVKIPVVIRLEGTNAAEGRQLLEGSNLTLAETMQEAASKIVEAVRLSS